MGTAFVAAVAAATLVRTHTMGHLFHFFGSQHQSSTAGPTSNSRLRPSNATWPVSPR